MEEHNTESNTPHEQPNRGDNSKKGANITGILVALVVVAVLIVIALQATGRIDLTSNDTKATVNGERITSEEVQERMDYILSTQNSELVDVNDPEVLATVEQQIIEEAINTKLLVQAGIEAGFSATEEEIEEQYNSVLDQVGAGLETVEEKEAQLETALQEAGLTTAEFRESIEDQVIIDKYLSSRIDEEALEVTEEEIANFYEQALERSPELPPLEEIRADVVAELRRQERDGLLTNILQELREAADVEIFE